LRDGIRAAIFHTTTEDEIKGGEFGETFVRKIDQCAEACEKLKKAKFELQPLGDAFRNNYSIPLSRSIESRAEKRFGQFLEGESPLWWHSLAEFPASVPSSTGIFIPLNATFLYHLLSYILHHFPFSRLFSSNAPFSCANELICKVTNWLWLDPHF
jgi:hypothetical protein